MLMTEIKRSTIVLPEQGGDAVLTLAADAEIVLGYSVLQNSLTAPPEVKGLARVLAELGIEVFDQGSVTVYMRERLCDKTLELLDEWQKSGPDPMLSWASFSGPSWTATPIAQYKEAIPEFVVNKALQIKRALPEAEIFIRHLTEDRDPFLEVRHEWKNEWDNNKGERYFVEVWEEPKFEGRLR